MALSFVIQFWSSDHQYGATIESLIPNGYFVTYDDWGNREEGPNPLSCKKKKNQKNPDHSVQGKDGDTTLRSRKKRNRSRKGKRLKVLKFDQLRHREQLRPMQPLKNAASMTEV
ncbi:PREDICTED: survival of motor neuron-related-splicing factor 30 [Prunus dulcis]|uniref:PREDICTED: survival of motor neuron-related-splicing factor 30 n=1 Tax=Prunus dulcis TaxID=3755 RepID=A0A5E4FM60_PRUDU|nr:PREDICTED: survival of motor neuron-related-splicing factor 30 [Prunus dulcis]